MKDFEEQKRLEIESSWEWFNTVNAVHWSALSVDDPVIGDLRDNLDRHVWFVHDKIELYRKVAPHQVKQPDEDIQEMRICLTQAANNLDVYCHKKPHTDGEIYQLICNFFIDYALERKWRVFFCNRLFELDNIYSGGICIMDDHIPSEEGDGSVRYYYKKPVEFTTRPNPMWRNIFTICKDLF